MDILEFTRYTWDGHDYVQYVWDDWLADPQGILAVAEYSGRAVGLAKVSKLAPGQWWLEGFRVAPAHQDMRIGSQLHGYVDGWWLEHGDGVARLMTSSQRTKVHHLCEKLGYTRIGEVAGYIAPPLEGTTEAFTPLQVNEISAAVDFTRASPSLPLSYGLLDLGWRFVTPNPGTLRELARRQLAWWWRDRQGLLLAWEDEGETPEDERTLAIGLPASPIALLAEFLLDVRRLAPGTGNAKALWIAPLREELTEILEAAGYERKWEHAGFLYEKQHPARTP